MQLFAVKRLPPPPENCVMLGKRTIELGGGMYVNVWMFQLPDGGYTMREESELRKLGG